MKSVKQGWSGHLLAMLAGALVTPSLAPFNLWPLGIASTALLVWLLSDLTAKQAAKRGWFYGLGLFGAGTSWVYVSIHVYGYAPAPLAAFLTLIFSAGLGIFTSVTFYCYVRWIRDQASGPLLGFAAIFVIGEWWRSWFLTGFPWLYIGYGHIDTPLAGWAPVGGIYAVGFVVALTGAVISYGLQQKTFIHRHIMMITTLWLGGFLLNSINWTTPADRPPINVAMVQANIPQEVKWRRDQYQATLKRYKQTSATLWAENDIVIWPEAAIPTYYQYAKPFLGLMNDRASQYNASLITGIPSFEEDEAGNQYRYNSIMAFGEGQGHYNKQRLVPFGEYVPLENLLRGLIQFFDMPMSNFSAGAEGQAAIQAGDITLAPFICYEIVYPELVSQWLPDADMLITISNDAWFGGSIGPLQHLEMAQMRALESGRYLLRSTGSGVSAIIDQRGKITVRGEQFTREVIKGEAQVFQGATPFSLSGSWPVLGLCFAIILLPQLVRLKIKS
ncbi:apolipoprotein N-acyltransferase [Oceanicoccus sagamiensis]|uniref:Apolipoprotein N-acyltransferase n=1 Tax=Oceanicoccus sagamiensis TaxID=716816 RepID=A0A1X9N9D7_9GAMM|nr:apolipoprotein N-acyltransferase [Oceanicoccus sagamiensis]ARN74698.1 apolipoprotein N-acyltransferase [Oceanicoccus sagamiensis]